MKKLLSVLAAGMAMMSMGSAHADEINMNVHVTDGGQAAKVPRVRLGLGVRVGGYGFRNLSDQGNIDWANCRMNGVGVFGTVDIGRHFFTELSLDGYHTTSEPEKRGLTRKSAISLVAVGARMFPDFVVSPYVQMGGGVEFSVAQLFEAEAYTVAPVGFVGVGGELNLGDMKLGMSIRSLIMPLPIYDWAATEGRVSWEMEFAGQALFTARYVF